MNDIQQPKYFEILRALHKGGLSLWLNRRTLLPMTLVPTVVTFLTLMMMRGTMTGEDSPSAFMLALAQIPADFVTGLLCALIIFIIMKAPKKGDKDKPVMFHLNILERKDLIIGGAVAHVVIGYFANGLMGGISMIYEPMQQAAQSGEEFTVGGGQMILVLGLLVFMFYATRFLILPVLVVHGMDIKGFFMRNRGFGFSIPVFLVKAATTTTIGFLVFMPVSLIVNAQGGADNMTATQYALVDFATAFGSVIAAAWTYAAFAIGVRQMMEGREKP